MNRARFHFALTPFVVALLGAAPIALFGCDDDANTTTDSGTHDGGTDGEVITHDGGDEDASITKYAVGGTVTGLEGTLTLTAGDDAELTLTDNGSFAFDDATFFSPFAAELAGKPENSTHDPAEAPGSRLNSL